MLAGYRLEIRTWENDSDHHSVQVLDGLTRTDVRFYLELVSKFTMTSGWANQSANPAELVPWLDYLLNFWEVSHRVTDLFWSDSHFVQAMPQDEKCHWYVDILCANVLGYTTEYVDEVDFCRVYDSHKLYFVPMNIPEISDEVFLEGH